MKRIFIVGFLCSVLIFLLAACDKKTEKMDNDLVYGKIVKIDETTITIERGNYENDESFKGLGEKFTYNLPEMVFFDNFKQGDLVAVLYDGKDATMITDVKNIVGASSEYPQADTSVEETEANLLSAVYEFDGTKSLLKDNVYVANRENQSVILAKNETTVTIQGSEINKAGDSTDLKNSSLYGLNATLATICGAKVNAEDVSISSNAEGADGVFVSGLKSSAILDNAIVNVTGNSSRGLSVAFGGAIEAEKANIITSGSESPCLYSSGNISLADSTGTAGKSQVAVIEGRNSIALDNCQLNGAGNYGIMFSQGDNSDSSSLAAKLASRNSEIHNKSTGPMFYVSGTYAVIALTNTTLTSNGEVLAEVVGTNDSNNKMNTGQFILRAMNQNLSGEIRCDQNSEAKLVLTEKSAFTGAFDTANTAAYSKIYLSKDSSWNVTADSYVGSITNEKKTCANIISNGNNIYYDSNNKANKWLEGKSIELSGGGKLTPAQ